MEDPTRQSRWCPSCGDEYEPRIAECLDCGVPLVQFRPTNLLPVDAPDLPEAGGETITAFDLRDFGVDQRADLVDYLEDQPLPHGWIDEHTIAPFAGYEDELLAVIRTIRQGQIPGVGFVPELSGELVPLRRRGLAWMVDEAVVMLAAAGGMLIFTGPTIPVIAVAVALLMNVVGFGERGASLGKRLLSARVRKRSGEQLTSGEALVRWLVRDMLHTITWVVWFTGGLGGGFVFPLASLAGLLALLATTMVDVHERGVHDLTIDSAVFRAGTIGLTDEYLGHGEILN